MIPTRLLVALASLLPLAVAECSKPCMSRCARALLDPVGSSLQKESCLAFLQQGKDATVPVELNEVCRSKKAYSRACSCIGVSPTVSPSSSATAHTPSMTQSSTPDSSAPPSSSNTPISSTALATSGTPVSAATSVSTATPESSVTPETSATPESSITPESSTAAISSTTPASTTIPEPTPPASSTTPISSTTPDSSTVPISSTSSSAAPAQTEFFDITVYVQGDPTPHNTGFRAITNGFALSWNYVPTVPGKMGIDPETGRLYALLDGRTDKLWGSTSLPLKGSLLLSFWTPAQIAAYEGSIVYVKCARDADGYVTCGYEDQDLARLKPSQNQNVVLGKHANAASTAISMLEYPVPAGYPTVTLLLK